MTKFTLISINKLKVNYWCQRQHLTIFPKISIKHIPHRQIVRSLVLSVDWLVQRWAAKKARSRKHLRFDFWLFLLYINRKKVRLFFCFCVVHTKTIIHLSSVLVKVVDIYLHFVQELLTILADCFCLWLFVFFL